MGLLSTLVTFLYNFKMTMERVNYALQLMNPHLASAYGEMRRRIYKRCPAAQAAAYHFNSQFMGLSIIYNRQTPRHRDNSGALWGVDGLLGLGNYSDGDLYLPALGVRLSYGPGTLNLLYGYLFEHQILPFIGQQKVCAAFFVHKNVLQEVGGSIPDIVQQQEPVATD
jgi:hypothetical protein